MSVADEVKERLDIVEVISSYVPLKKAGRTFKALCPFHGEKTPSFVVFPESQNWHCFGACNTGGDIFSFVMRREHLDFPEALAFLAAKAGVQLQQKSDQPSEDERQLERQREISADAAGYFQYLLMNASEALIARNYLEHRGLSRETWEAWQLGYALDTWDSLKDRLAAKGYGLSEIEAAGLIVPNQDGTGHYDRFRGRLMIPIRDAQGRVIGFGARLLREESGRPQPKYLNSPDTPLFTKSRVLYGLDMARRAIRTADLAVIVEGYMDVLMSHQVGVANVVAGMGTALTEEQLRLLKRYSNNVTLALDPDAAGISAALRGIDTARQTLDREWLPVIGPGGLVRQESRLKAQIRIASLPDGLDPDELARQDVARWRQVIAEAKPVIDYYLRIVTESEDLSSGRGKSNVIARMAPLVAEIANPVERQHYLQALGRLIHVDERLVAQQVAVVGRQKDRSTTEPRGATQSATEDEGVSASDTAESSGREAPSGREEHILGCLLWRPELLSRLDAVMIDEKTVPLDREDFRSSENGAVLAALQSIPATRRDWSAEDVLSGMAAPLQARCRGLVERVLANPAISDETMVKDLANTLLRLRAYNLRQRIGQLQFLILECSESGELDQLRQYTNMMSACSAQKRHIDRLLNKRSMVGSRAASARS